MAPVKTKKLSARPAPDPNQPQQIDKVSLKVKGKKRSNFVDRWWLEPERDIFQHVSAILSTLDNRQVSRHFSNIRWLRLYSNYDAVGLSGGVFSRLMPQGSYAARSYRFTLNVVESCIDAAAAKIAKSRPVPRIITSKGSFKQQKKSKLLTKYLKGKISELDIYEKAQMCFVDCCIFGTGVMKLFVEDGKIKAVRVLADDITVDEEDGRDGDPRQMHQRTYVNRDVLMELFPDFADKIAEAGTVTPGEKFSPISQDLVGVVESWHLPSSDGAEDGRHTICLSNCTLVAEEWEHSWFPFAFLRWKPRPLGFYGMGLAEQLGPIQLEINKLCILIQESILRMAKPNVFVPSNSKIIAEQISDIIGAVIHYESNTPNAGLPTVMVPQAQSPEVYQWLENLYSKAYQISGISQLSAQSQKPAGLNSGAALREFQDIETSRFELTGQRYENFFCDIARMIITLSKELYQDDKKLSVKVQGRKFIEQIDWKDAELSDDEFTMDIFPVSSLPDSPAGRLEQIQQYAQAGYIDKNMTMELLDLPDLDDYVSLEVAGIENAKMVVDKARWDGEGTIITPQMNWSALVSFAHNSWLDATTMDTPQENMDLLVKIMNDAQDWIDQSQAPPAAPQPGQAQAQPMAPPQSELLPNGAGPG